MSAKGSESEALPPNIALNGFRYDLEANELLDGAGERVQLRPQCLGVLRCLAQRAGQVVSKEELMHAVWPGMIVTDDSLVHCVGELRHALGDARRRVLQTEPRRGYRLVSARVPNGGATGDSTGDSTGDATGDATGDSTVDGLPSQEIRFAISADGVRIAYASHGQGVPVVRAARFASHLDHDLSCLTEGPILQAVARRHRLIRFDQRGQGLSDRHVDVGTLEDSVRDLEAVVDAEGLSRFVLWAIGSGVASAVRFAALHPERVERLILSAGWARGVAHRTGGNWAALGASTLRFIEALWDKPYTSRASVRFDWREYPGATPEQLLSYDELQRLSCSGAVAASAIGFSAEFDVTGDLGKVRCPALVTHSAREHQTPFDEARLMVAGIPGARLATLDSDNHMPLPQEPAFDALVMAMDEFIDEGEPMRHASASTPSDQADRSSSPRPSRGN